MDEYELSRVTLTVTPADVASGAKEALRKPLDAAFGVFARVLKRHFRTNDVQVYDHSGWVFTKAGTRAIFFCDHGMDDAPSVAGSYELETHFWRRDGEAET